MAYVAGPEVLDAVRRASARAVIDVHGKMKRGLSSIASIAVTAPLAGAIGTLLSIHNSFQGTAGDEWSNFAAVVEGLSESLMPTELGLLVALLVFLGHAYFIAKLQDFDVEMENASLQLINQLATTRFS